MRDDDREDELHGSSDMKTQTKQRTRSQTVRGSLAFVLALLLVSSAAWSRQDPLQDRSFTKLPGYKSTNVSPKPGEKIAEPFFIVGPPLEEVIDAKEYIVGPNDVFGLLLPGVSDLTLPIIVSPEGSLLVPNVGEIYVAGKTLESAKADVLDAVSKNARLIKPSFTLLSPRQILVTVLGSVRSPGPYVVASSMRVDKAIAIANITNQPQNPAIPWNGDFSRRRITIRQTSGDRIVDLELFFSEGRKDQNPYLLEGDVIIVPPRNISQASISIFGAVNQQGEYEYREYDTLLKLIRMANGLTPNADSSNVEITSFNALATRSESRLVDLRPILAGMQSDIPLSNKDRVVIRQINDRRRDFKVQARGEVRFPGFYPITEDSTRLSEVIARAGGFTEYAYLEGAEIERKQLTATGMTADPATEALLNARLNDQLITPEERTYYEMEAKLRRGTVAVEFNRLFLDRDSTADIYLKDGDFIFIPNNTQTVYVYGQVPKPGYVSFKPGAGLSYYLQQAGGFGEEADEGKTRVIKAKTREWKEPSDTMIESGDTIWVPKDIRYPFGYYMNLVSQAAGFISVILSMTVIIIQLSKNN